jgi:trigger factor
MKVELENLDKVRKSIEVVLDEDKVNQLREKIYDDLKKRAKIKGFRPGKVPRSVIQAFYKDFVDDELKRKMVEETMVDALSEVKVEPVSEPRIEFLDGDKPGYKIECEVVPEFELPPYEKIGVEVEKIQVTDEEIDKRIESLRQMHSQMIEREGEEGARKGDFAVVKYEGFLNGQPVKDVKSDAYTLDLGSSTLLPEFESAIIGMKVGEEKEVEITFPDDYPDKGVAAKTLLFKVLVKEIKEKKLPELNDEFAKDIGFENVGALRTGVAGELEKEKDVQKKQSITEQLAAHLLEKTDIPVPSRLLQKRVEMLVQDARTRMKTGTLSADDEANLNAALSKECEPEAEKRIKMGMILSKIADQQGLKVEDSEVDDRLRRIAEETKRAYDYIRDFYEKYDLKGSLKNSMVEEKTIDFLIEKAEIKEKE